MSTPQDAGYILITIDENLCVVKQQLPVPFHQPAPWMFTLYDNTCRVLEQFGGFHDTQEMGEILDYFIAKHQARIEAPAKALRQCKEAIAQIQENRMRLRTLNR